MGPIAERLNECTLFTTPLRVRKVPRIVSANVATTSARFQVRRRLRFSSTMTEWRYAVDVSHGMIAAFSTGSHAQ